jgi:hypothetical protein
MTELTESIKKAVGRIGKERAFEEKFPGTPFIIGEVAENHLKSLRNKKEQGEAISIKDVLIPAGLHFRHLFVDTLRKGDSHGACWEFSVRLRDLYNHMLSELDIPNEAHLINGDFGNQSRSGHHWVVVTEKGLSDLNKLEGGILVDGTVDQYRVFGSTKILVLENGDERLRYYHPRTISPVPVAYFAKKQTEP